MIAVFNVEGKRQQQQQQQQQPQQPPQQQQSLQPSRMSMSPPLPPPNPSMIPMAPSAPQAPHPIEPRPAIGVHGVLVPVTAGQAKRKRDEEHEGPVRKYPCPHHGCGRVFARLFNLRTHEKTHNPNSEKPFTCTAKGCTKAFARKHDLSRHETSVHEGRRDYQCQLCSKLFSRKDALRRHLAVKACTGGPSAPIVVSSDEEDYVDGRNESEMSDDSYESDRHTENHYPHRSKVPDIRDVDKGAANAMHSLRSLELNGIDRSTAPLQTTSNVPSQLSPPMAQAYAAVPRASAAPLSTSYTSPQSGEPTNRHRVDIDNGHMGRSEAGNTRSNTTVPTKQRMVMGPGGVEVVNPEPTNPRAFSGRRKEYGHRLPPTEANTRVTDEDKEAADVLLALGMSN